jgi:glycosyltransferase involved in cell wall biosynthesis
MILPPWKLVKDLLNPWKPLPWDILHVFGPMCLAIVPLLPLFYLRSVKIYVSYHVYLNFYKKIYLKNPIASFLIEWIFSVLYFIPFVMWADVVGIPSKTADSLVFDYAKRIHVMKSGLQTDVFKPIDGQLSVSPWNHIVSKRSGPTLVYVGRLAGEKNVEFLINALSHQKLKHYTLVLVGDGPSRKSLEQLATSIVGKGNVFSKMLNSDSTRDDVEDSERARVVFTGMIHSQHFVAQHYGHADVFVSASASETFGFTVAEAMACGIPAVVVRSGAFETVYSCISDWMFTPDETEDYVEKLVYVTKLGQGARQVARHHAIQKFGVERAVDDLLAVYQMVISNNYLAPVVLNSTGFNRETFKLDVKKIQ